MITQENIPYTADEIKAMVKTCEKYNKALERARMGLHDCNLLPCDDMTRKAAITIIYHLFPELAEDEDERIRKGIIRNLQYLMDRSEGFVKEDLQERIAWLEKQSEQKTDPCTDCTNDKGCVTCEHGGLRETHTRTLNADEVIGWLVANICDFEYYVKRFKQDFGI